jgi:hypothetical protein
MKNLFYLLFIGLVSCVYSNDVIFMIDSSKSIFGSEQCDYAHLIQNFTSDFVDELSSGNSINFASVQYNVKGTIDFPFCNNNSDVYDKMKHYDFNFGAPTVIHTGLEKVTELYSDNLSPYSNEESIYLILLSDGETLNKVDFQNALSYYPFNSTQFNTILIKIGTHVVDNNIVLDVFNNSELNYLTCEHNPLEHILNNTLFYPTTTMSSTTSSSSNNTSRSIRNNYTTTSTNISNKNSSIDCGNNSIPNSNDTHSVISIYKILVYVTAGIIFLFSVLACFCICCYKTNKKIKPSIDNETGNNSNVIHQGNIMPMFGRSITNEIYESNYAHNTHNTNNAHNAHNGEYIEVDDSDDSVDNHNYLRYNSEKTTDF